MIFGERVTAKPKKAENEVKSDREQPAEEVELRRIELKPNTSLQTLEYVFVSLVAIYDAGTAFFDGQPDKLIQHHLKNFKGRWAKKPEPDTGFVIEYQSSYRMITSPEYYYCKAKNDKQAALRFKRRYRSFMDESTDTILRVISQKSDAVLFEKFLPECYNYSAED